MICTTIQNRNLEQIYEALEHCEMAEIRLDRCELTAGEIDELFSSDIPLVATCRVAEVVENEPSLQDPALTEQSREIKAMQIAEKRLVRAIEAGARYVDVELEAQKQMSKRIRQAAHENGTVFIRSYHDFSGTDSQSGLRAIVEKCVYHGADMVKIATTALSEEDVENVMSLYQWCRDEKEKGNDRVGALADGGLVAFCMGEAGRASRLDCLKNGAPYTYASYTHEESAAPGQWTTADMIDAVYGGYSFIGTWGAQIERLDASRFENDSAPQTNGENVSLAINDNVSRTKVPDDSQTTGPVEKEPLRMPVSKSFAQRAIIAAALADGVSHLRGYTPCGDNEAAVRVAQNLGAEVELKGNVLTVKGVSAGPGCLDISQFHVGESGLLTRMMIPLMAQLGTGPVTLTGEKTLLERPLTGAKEIMDALVEGEDAISTHGDGTVRVPLTVRGPLKTGRSEVSGKHGSQLISGLLMALPFADRNSTLIVHEPKSIPYMFITLEVLRKFGIKTGNEMLGGRDFLESDGDWSLCTEMVFKVRGGQRYKAADIRLEGDWSAAANFLVAGALFGKVEVEGLDTTSLQADLSIMDILMDAGASLSQLDGDKGCVTVQRAPLRAFSVDASNCPDLFPIVSVLAAFCQGTSRIRGVGRLANKESDRAKAISDMLTAMGVKVEIDGDEMVVEGYTLAQRLLTGRLLKGGNYTSCHDHRMVMALKVASLGTDGPIMIDDEYCVEKSFPQFHETFEQLYI